MYGHNVRGPLDLMKEAWTTIEQPKKEITHYLSNLRDRLTTVQELAGDNESKAKARMERWYNRNARVRVLNVGDMVTILGPSLKHSMSTERQGPFPVVKVVTPVTYLVKLGVGRKPIRLFACFT